MQILAEPTEGNFSWQILVTCICITGPLTAEAVKTMTNSTFCYTSVTINVAYDSWVIGYIQADTSIVLLLRHTFCDKIKSAGLSLQQRHNGVKEKGQENYH